MQKNSQQHAVIFWICLAAAACATAACAAFLAIPLSPLPDGETVLWDAEAPPGQTNGWDVYIMEDGVRRSLTPEGGGYFSGTSRAGQTFFASRTLEKVFASPQLETNTGCRFAVFLDEDLIYTDGAKISGIFPDISIAPEAAESIFPERFSLPGDYAGHVLTIAQTSLSEKDTAYDGSFEVFFGPVILYDNVWYESDISAATARTAYPATALAVIGILLLVTFLVGARTQSPDAAMAFLCAFVLLWMADICVGSDALNVYYESWWPFAPVFYYGSLTFLFLFMGAHMERFRKPVYVLSAADAGSAVLDACMQACGANVMYISDLPVWLSCVLLIACIVFAFFEARRGNAFYRLFSRLFPVACGIFVVLVLAGALGPDFNARSIGIQASLIAYGAAPSYLLYLGRALLIGVCVACALTDFVRTTVRRRTDAALIEQRMETAERSANQLKRHARETAMLQHDMRRHLGTISLYLQSGETNRALSYLEDIGAGIEALPSIADTGNVTVDLLLNAKLGEAAEKGICTQVGIGHLPEELPLTESETASVLLNTLDNAIRAAAMTSEKHLSVRLYVRGSFLCYVCSNSSSASAAKSAAAAGHGYGLRIVRGIAERHDGLVEVDLSPGTFRITCLFPLEQAALSGPQDAELPPSVE